MDYYINLPTDIKQLIKSFLPRNPMYKAIDNYNHRLNYKSKKKYNESFYNFLQTHKLNKVYTTPTIKTNIHKWISIFENKHKNKFSNEFIIKHIYKFKQDFKVLPEKEYSILVSKKPEDIKKRLKEHYNEYMEKRIHFLDDELYQQIILKNPIKSNISYYNWEIFISNEYIHIMNGNKKNIYTTKTYKNYKEIQKTESKCLVKIL